MKSDQEFTVRFFSGKKEIYFAWNSTGGKTLMDAEAVGMDGDLPETALVELVTLEREALLRTHEAAKEAEVEAGKAAKEILVPE